jgi:hypothetical protein
MKVGCVTVIVAEPSLSAVIVPLTTLTIDGADDTHVYDGGLTLPDDGLAITVVLIPIFMYIRGLDTSIRASEGTVSVVTVKFLENPPLAVVAVIVAVPACAPAVMVRV